MFTTSHMRRTLARENFSSARRRPALSLSMLKVPNVFPLNEKFRERSFDTSVGRAEDCRSVVEFLRSLVRIRLERIFYFVNITDSYHATYSKLFS